MDEFKTGDRVRTTDHLTDRDFNLTARLDRHASKVGTVIGFSHGGHGICVRVKYDDYLLMFGYFDPDELTLLPPDPDEVAAEADNRPTVWDILMDRSP